MNIIPPVIAFALAAIPSAFATTVQVEPTVIAVGLKVTQRIETLEAESLKTEQSAQMLQAKNLNTLQPTAMLQVENLTTPQPTLELQDETLEIAQELPLQELNPEQALSQFTSLLSADLNNAEQIIQAAMESMPEFAEQIAQLARDNEVENETITTAALLAGIDPTRIAEATAAGISRIASVAPPATPSIGGNGGGGIRVVSPN
ncbi:hypothetical protein [Vibrio tapetis]|uniref:Uncharacterized protein n=1 Tax=Vibrio tapetis subsp. tapetis TaxID=1671868 RepID=A0A2N8ZLJ0_9VIBR|nr:hypothetical protein [Vibrio tapetis]SON52781.1 exported protein of unknown function [Vibrio tapetis subsp. tapetis]